MNKKQKKTRTLKTMAMRLWVILTGILVLVFLLYAVFLTRHSREEIKRVNRSLTDHYAESLDKDIRRMLDTINEMYANNIFYQRLIWYQLDDYDWVDNTWHIHTALRESSAALDFEGGHFYYDRDHDSMRSAFHMESQDSRMNDALKAYLAEFSEEKLYNGYFTYKENVWCNAAV